MRDFQELQKEKQTLRAENDALASKTTRVEEEVSGLWEAQKNLKQELERLASERLELQNKGNLLQEERDKLLERLRRSLAGVAAPTAVATTAMLPAYGGHEYFAGGLKEKGNLELQLYNLK